MKEPIRVKMAQRNTPDAMMAFREYRSPVNADIGSYEEKYEEILDC
jgi:hypothetical protein